MKSIDRHNFTYHFLLETYHNQWPTYHALWATYYTLWATFHALSSWVCGLFILGVWTPYWAVEITYELKVGKCIGYFSCFIG